MPFSDSISAIIIANNPFNCLPNHTLGMSYALWSVPICGPGNTNGCVQNIKESHFEYNISVYPNPANSILQVDISGYDMIEVSIADVLGAEVKKIIPEIKSRMFQIDISNLKEGIYFVSIKTLVGTSTSKIIVQR